MLPSGRMKMDEALGTHTVKATGAINHTEGMGTFDVIE